MSFLHDRRGQSVVIGTVILFGFLIVALAVYQAQVVPQENAQVEFEHSQQVEGEFVDLRTAISRAGSTGSAQSQRIRLGTRYPQRTFFVNPPPATGQLSTTDERNITFENAEIGSGAHENVEVFWNETSPEFPTRSLQYNADYTEYREDPTLTSEHSVVAAEFDERVLFRTDQTVLRNDRVTLTTVLGEVSENGVEARSVDVDPVSQGTRSIPITGDGIEIVLPTAVDNEAAAAERWAERLPPDADVEPGEGTLTITLPESEDPYRLRLSAVSLDGSGEAEAAYIVPVGPETVSPNGSIGVEVRDKYNNPVEDAEVDIFVDGGEDPEETIETDDDGRVFTGADSTGTIIATINDGIEDYEVVEFEVRSEAEELRTFQVDWQAQDSAPISEGRDRDLPVRVTDRETGEPIVDATVDASYSVDSAVGEGPDDVEAADRTDSDGRTTVNFDASNAEADDRFRLYASSGDDVDQIFIDVLPSDALGFGEVTASDLDVQTNDQTQTFTFELSGDLDAGETVNINLDDSQSRSGGGGGPSFQVDYQGATGNSGDGDVTVMATAENANIEFTANENIEDGEEVSVTVSGVDVGNRGQQNDPYTVTFTRNDSGATADTTFEVD